MDEYDYIDDSDYEELHHTFWEEKAQRQADLSASYY